jgi:hypothetical protein
VPSVVRQGQGPAQQIEVRGEHFRPYMRVSFNNAQGRTFLFYGSGSAFVQLPELAPGKYDVVLYDYMQEVSRLPAALTFEAPPPPPAILVDVGGYLTSLTDEQAKSIQPGHQLPEGGTDPARVLSVGRPEPELLRIKTGDKTALTVQVGGLLQLPARIRTRCLVEKAADGSMLCSVSGTPLVADANVTFNGLGRALNFRVSDVTAAAPPGR